MKVNTIETSRLLMREKQLADVTDFFEILSNPKTTKYMPINFETNIEEYKIKFKNTIKLQEKEEGFYAWAVELKNESKVIGCVTIEKVNKEHSSCEISYMFNNAFTGFGYAHEATKVVIEFIFNELKLNRIEAFVWEGNEKSCNLLKNLNFTLEGTMREAKVKNNKFLDYSVYSILNNEYKNLVKIGTWK